jgi:murein DD-endopeptidase MepM/ murein hydrolase activator NlpD
MRILSVPAAERWGGPVGFPSMNRLGSGAVLFIIAAVILFFIAMIWLSPGSPVPEKAVEPKAEPVVVPTGLAIPVAGIHASQLSDTYTQARAGGRAHDAIDIMAPRGTPVFAAAGGTIEKLYFSRGGGGITAYIRSPDRRFVYYYAHLDAYAAGLREGQRVVRGDPIGTVGSTGNASAAGPHLHFAIHATGENDRWYQGRAINPYPLLAGRGSPR